MSTPNPLDLLRDRGFVQDVTDEEGLRAAFDSGPVTFYYGMDPTAPSLHSGNLIGLMAMGWLQRLGHRPIALAGGGTGRIGDPSFKDVERPLIDEDTLQNNLEGIRRQASQFVDLQAGLLVDNYDWLGQLDLMGFLRDVGKYVSVNQMIAREAVKKRLQERDQGISFTEFCYALLQAYDFVHLYRTQGCRLQVGGSDQWGNITAGTDLVRRMENGQAFGLVWPLLTTAAGEKFSKSTGNAVWLDPDLTSPYAYYQSWINVSDDDVGQFLKLFTFLALDDIGQLLREHDLAPAQRIAQKRLAQEATRIVHGQPGLDEALRATEVLFGDQPFNGLSDAVLDDAFAGAPAVQLAPDSTTGGMTVAQLMTLAGAATSSGEARRLVGQGGVRINNVPVADATRLLTTEDLSSPSTVIMRVGKKRYFIGRVDTG